MASHHPPAVAVFRAGAFSTLSGDHHTITEAELTEIAEGYKPSTAPMFVSHAGSAGTAMAWIESLHVKNGTLYAVPRDGAASFSSAVNEGAHHLSFITLYTPNAPGNPVPGSMHLHQVGFVDQVSFSSGLSLPASGVGLIQAQRSAPPPRTSEEKALRTEREMRIEALINQGRLLPAFRDEVLSFAASLERAPFVSFASGEVSPAKDWFMSFLERQPTVVSFGAMDIGPDPFSGMAPDMHLPSGYQVDRAQSDLYNKAKEIARVKGISFSDAVSIVSAGL